MRHICVVNPEWLIPDQDLTLLIHFGYGFESVSEFNYWSTIKPRPLNIGPNTTAKKYDCDHLNEYLCKNNIFFFSKRSDLDTNLRSGSDRHIKFRNGIHKTVPNWDYWKGSFTRRSSLVPPRRRAEQEHGSQNFPLPLGILKDTKH